MKHITKIATLFTLSTSLACAFSPNQFYGAVQAGIYRAQFNNKYLDQTDFIPQNISDSIMQNGYLGGLTIGYTRLINENYFIGAELTGNITGNSALYQTGAANTAFSDNIQINRSVDLTVTPGIITKSAFFPYVRVGVSRASVLDHLTSPVGYNPVMTQYNTNQNVNGFVAGLGVRYIINDRGWLFVETNYHDYGTVNFSSFQNFSASYSHSAHVYSYAALIGAAYAFNV